MSMKLDGNSLVAVRQVVTSGGTPITNTNPVEVPLSQLMAAGGFEQGVAVPNAAAAPTQAEFNALLTSLRNAGLIAT